MPREWYRSTDEPPAVGLTWQRHVRDRVIALLPQPDVRGRVMVMRSRRTLPAPSGHGFQSQYHGLFSEFHSVLGALHYGLTHGAAGVRVTFASPLYVDSARGPNWWLYFFERDLMRFDDGDAACDEIVLNGIVTRYGRYGGFADVVQGCTPYLYPMTFGLHRRTLHRYVTQFATIRGEIQRAAAERAAALFEPGAFVVGVHYRGTDAVHQRWDGFLRHYRSDRVPYATYAAEVRRVLDEAAPALYHVFVATDEQACLAFMRREFGDRVVAVDAPRAGDDGTAVHLDLTRSPWTKGESAMLDALLLASTDYLVKGRSNLSDASLVFNPDLRYSFRPDVPLAPNHARGRIT
jgi:hypothetical protein